MATEYLLNTDTRVLVPKTPVLDPKPYLEPYKPTEEEIRIGRPIDIPVVPRVAEPELVEAHEPVSEVASTPEPIVTEFVERDQGLAMDAYDAPETKRRRGRPRGT